MRRTNEPKRCRLTRYASSAGALKPEDLAAVRQQGRARVLRYCARPPFALERLEQVRDDQLIYRFPRPLPDGRTELRLTSLELIERLATLIPPLRLHRHRYHGVLAPNAPQRAQVTALARQPILPATAPNAATSHAPALRSSARYMWAVLLARIYEILLLRCGLCGGEMRIIAFVTGAPALQSILTHLGEPTTPPTLARAGGPTAVGPGERARASLGGRPSTRARVCVRPAPELVSHYRFTLVIPSRCAMAR